MPLEIPKEDVGAIVLMRGLMPASIERLVAALAGAPLISNPRKMVQFITDAVPDIPQQQLGPIIETLYTLHQIRELSGVNQKRFIEDLIDGVTARHDLNLPEKALPGLRITLERFMGIETLRTIAKAARLLRDGERLYCRSKILSDVRPVFGKNPSEGPVGAVLAHTLKIGFHSGSAHREFHIVLDASDLGDLLDVIQRAQEKDRALRGLLKAGNLPALDE
jgi:hypothetical protein